MLAGRYPLPGDETPIAGRETLDTESTNQVEPEAQTW